MSVSSSDDEWGSGDGDGEDNNDNHEDEETHVPQNVITRKIPINVPANQKRLQDDLAYCNRINPQLIVCSFIGDKNSSNQWDVLLRPLPDSSFARALANLNKTSSYKEDGIHLTVIFPADYPNQIPFIYNTRPKLKGAHFFSGSFCTSSIGSAKWSPVFSVSQPLQSVCDLILYHKSVTLLNESNDFSTAVSEYFWLFGQAHPQWGLATWIKNI